MTAIRSKMINEGAPAAVTTIRVVIKRIIYKEWQ